MGVIFSPTVRPGSLSKLQSAARAMQLFVERAEVGDRVVDRGVDLGRDACGGELVGGGLQLVRLERHLVEVAQRTAHGLVAVARARRR